MKRKQLIDIFGNTANAAYALNVTSQAVYLWPKHEELSVSTTDRVIGAAIRTGMINIGEEARHAILKKFYCSSD